jgi:hypothetical protein
VCDRLCLANGLNSCSRAPGDYSKGIGACGFWA